MGDRIAYQNIHDDIQVMSDPETLETDAAEIARGKNVNECQSEEKQHTSEP